MHQASESESEADSVSECDWKGLNLFVLASKGGSPSSSLELSFSSIFEVCDCKSCFEFPEVAALNTSGLHSYKQ